MLYITILLNYSDQCLVCNDLELEIGEHFLYPAPSLQMPYLKTILKDFRKCVYIYVCLYILCILLLLH